MARISSYKYASNARTDGDSALHGCIPIKTPQASLIQVVLGYLLLGYCVTSTINTSIHAPIQIFHALIGILASRGWVVR